MTERMGEGSDGLAAIFPAMLNSLIALHALGYPNDHPLYAKAKRDFEGLFVDDPGRFPHPAVPFAGLGYRDQYHRAGGIAACRRIIRALQKAAALAGGRRKSGFAAIGLMNNPHPRSERLGFRVSITSIIPTPTTPMMVLMALRLVRPNEPRRGRAVFERALKWQLSFQCHDGGWAASTKM